MDILDYPDPKRIKLVLIRHTQTQDNESRIYSGQRNVPLNLKGVSQALRLAQNLADKPLAAIYASDLRRASLVTDIIQIGHPSIQIYPDARLRELNLGQMTGITKEEALVRFPERFFRTSSDEYDFRPIGGESRTEVVERHFSLFREIRKRHQEDDLVAIVGHGTALRTILRAFRFEGPLHEQGDYTQIDLPAYF